MCKSKHEKILKLKMLDELLEELHYELTDEGLSECSETIAISDMIWNAQERLGKEIAKEEEKNKLDTHVYIVIQKVKNNRKEETILNIFNECFSNQEQAESYVQGHYGARRIKKCYMDKGWQLTEDFETDYFIYQIRKVAIVGEYEYDKDRIIYRR